MPSHNVKLLPVLRHFPGFTHDKGFWVTPTWPSSPLWTKVHSPIHWFFFLSFFYIHNNHRSNCLQFNWRTMKPKCRKHSQRSAEAPLSRPSCDTASKTPLKIMLCRYKGGRLLKRTKVLGETKYTAVSHVWGTANWQTIKSLDEEVLASKEKVKFMENQLPSIMENRLFWMDILCIDQKDDAKIAVTQHIPTIFRSARKTLAVRESWGFTYCCSEATKSS